MDPGPDVETHRHHHTGRRWLDTVLAVSAISISLFSAVLALQHGRAMERMVEASTWPFVTVADSNSDEQGHPIYRIQMLNEGVGPAKIESLHLLYRRHPYGTVFELAKAVLHDEGGQGPAGVVHSDALVIPARGSVTILDANSTVSSPETIQALLKARNLIDVSVCYCSIFEDCWTVTSQGPSSRPRKVHQCAEGDA